MREGDYRGRGLKRASPGTKPGRNPGRGPERASSGTRRGENRLRGLERPSPGTKPGRNPGRGLKRASPWMRDCQKPFHPPGGGGGYPPAKTAFIHHRSLPVDTRRAPDAIHPGKQPQNGTQRLADVVVAHQRSAQRGLAGRKNTRYAPLCIRDFDALIRSSQPGTNGRYRTRRNRVKKPCFSHGISSQRFLV